MKKIFYYTDCLPFLGKGEKAIDKLERNLQIFREASQEITLVWHPWSCTDHYLEINNSEVRDRYHQIVNEYKNQKWGEFDETATFEEAKQVLLECNGYYGDYSNLVYEAQNAKLPVMIQNIDI